jgi:hypothetical protein
VTILKTGQLNGYKKGEDNFARETSWKITTIKAKETDLRELF